jgi:hydrogenase nickel incorporation protein HypA/HybF
MARLKNGDRIVKVGVQVGDLSGVDVEALRFSFEVIVMDSDLAPLELIIERIVHSRHCGVCPTTFTVDLCEFDASCPVCGNLHTEFAGGDELAITYLELEEH